MNIINAIILGIVEGLSEFLPISSTGHLILADKILNIYQNEFVKSFNISIQLGAILAVVVLYWKSLFLDKETIKRVIVSFLPTALIGLILYKFVKTILLGNYMVVVFSLFFGGVVLIFFEKFYKEKNEDTSEIRELSYKKTILIGVFQSIAMIPGVSRSAATIIGGLILGVKRKTIVEFSFLLAVPTMIAATGLDLFKSSWSFSMEQFVFLLIGFVTAFIVAVFSIKFFLNYIKNNNFIPFGIYRIILATVFFLLV